MSTANKKENALSPVEEKIVKELVTEGREKGFVTIDEINENLGDETPSAEQLEKIFDIFSTQKGNVLSIYPTYGMIEIYCKTHKYKLLKIKESNFGDFLFTTKKITYLDATS